MVARRARRSRWLVAIGSSRVGVVGLTLVLAMLAIAIFGPLLAPYGQATIASVPFQGPTPHDLLGTDVLGRDVLSRMLYGGRVLLVVTGCATIIGEGIGIWLGLNAGYRQGRAVDLAVIAVTDLLIAFPALVLGLIVIAGLGSSLIVVGGIIAVAIAPGVARLVRAATVDIVSSEYVEVAVSRGDSSRYIVLHELLPNIWDLILADVGIRWAAAAILYASLSFLGFGPAPPAADWGVMISENAPGLVQQPWAVVGPALAIVLFIVGVNLLGDAISEALGRSRLDEPVEQLRVEIT